MDINAIRRLIIIAVCSDDYLLDRLVLKGGNALSLVYGIGNRTSVDIDFSMGEDFEELEEARRRLFASLSERFDTRGFVVFDESLKPKPSAPTMPFWGGYIVEFKLISRERAQKLGGSLEAMRKQAQSVGDTVHSRKFRIEISKYEYVEGKEEAEIEDYLCYVYTLEMIAAEKLRAICQQMEGYAPMKSPRPRARDFFDLYSIISHKALDLSAPGFHELLRHVFEAKRVPLAFLARIQDQRAFHAQDWPAVRDSIIERAKDFDFYFDFVVEEARKLQPLWKE